MTNARTDFSFWDMCYRNEWVSIELVKLAVSAGKITAEEFKGITGQEYVA